MQEITNSMTSYLITSTDEHLAIEKALEISKKKKISPFDITRFDLKTAESKTGTKKSWGIGDIKELQKKIYLKPLRGKWKAVIMQNAETLTVEAQNSLLKLLEEPPSGTLIILLSSSEDTLLPTIRSRCSILRLKNDETSHTIDRSFVISEVDALSKASIGDRLKKAEALGKNKDSALAWLTNCQVSLHDILTTDPSPRLASRLKLFHEAHKTIRTSNANLRLTLENFFLALK
jgi:hypothetical protein